MKHAALLKMSAAALGAAVALGFSVGASASLTINPNGGPGDAALPETALDGGPGFPLGITGVADPSLLVAQETGLYTFTFEGAGNAGNTNTFTVTNGTLISGTDLVTAVGPGGTGAGSTLAGTSFTEFFTAGQTIDFILHSSGGCTIVSGHGPDGVCSYLIALPDSSLGPNATAWIGFGDNELPGNSDYQDLVIRVDEVPEPATLGLIGAGLAGLAVARRRNKR